MNRVMHLPSFVVCTLALLCAWPGAEAHAQSFPTSTQWIALMRDGVIANDPQNDSQGERDIVGDAQHAAAFVYGDASFLYFRVRLDQKPTTTGGQYRPFGWGVEIDADGDLSAYEALSMVDGIDNPDIVALRQNTASDAKSSARDLAEVTIATYDIATHAISSQADTTFGADADFFLDWAIDRKDLQAAGVDLEHPLRFTFGTSNNAQTLASDLMGTTTAQTLVDTVSDPVSCAGDSCEDCTDLCGSACLRCEGATPACDGERCVQCASSADCPNEEPVCDRASGTCSAGAPCSDDGDCKDADHPACQPDGSCGECANSHVDACQGTTPSCDVKVGRCVACAGDADCSDPQSPACQPDGSCGECSGDNDVRCVGDAPRCDLPKGECSAACTKDADCDDPAHPVCMSNGDCGECSADDTDLCDATLETCNVPLGECTERCDEDLDCSTARPFCSDQRACRECSVGDTSACPKSKPACDGEAGVCVAADCVVDSDCKNPGLPACRSDGLCVQCSASHQSRCAGALPECDADQGVCVPEGEGTVGSGSDGGTGSDAGSGSGAGAEFRGGGLSCAVSSPRATRAPLWLSLLASLWLVSRRRRTTRRQGCASAG